MNYENIMEIIDGKYHHNLYYSGIGVNLTFDKKNKLVNSFDTVDNIFNEKPGIWFSLSEDKKVIRCGTHTNIKHKLNSFSRIESESTVYANESIQEGENGVKDMKRIKQEFKRLLTHSG